MPGATRTQIYLTAEQRARLDELARREGKTLAHVIREAVDAYIADPSRESLSAVLSATFGAAPDIAPPRREEWDRGHG